MPLAGAAAGTRRLSAADPWVLNALTRVGEALFSGARGSSATAVFASIDSNGDGILSKEEFCGALRALHLGFSEAETEAIMDVVDVNRSGNINYIEFTSAFRFRDANAPPLRSMITSWAPEGAASEPGGGAGGSTEAGGGGAGGGSGSAETSAGWQRGVIERIVAVLFEYRFELAAAFSLFDTDRSGKISRDELRIGLNSISSLTGSPLTEGQADELMRALDTDGDGEIDWLEFVNAFRLVDTVRAAKAPADATKASGNGGGGLLGCALAPRTLRRSRLRPRPRSRSRPRPHPRPRLFFRLPLAPGNR